MRRAAQRAQFRNSRNTCSPTYRLNCIRDKRIVASTLQQAPFESGADVPLHGLAPISALIISHSMCHLIAQSKKTLQLFTTRVSSSSPSLSLSLSRQLQSPLGTLTVWPQHKSPSPATWYLLIVPAWTHCGLTLPPLEPNPHDAHARSEPTGTEKKRGSTGGAMQPNDARVGTLSGRPMQQSPATCGPKLPLRSSPESSWSDTWPASMQLAFSLSTGLRVCRARLS